MSSILWILISVGIVLLALLIVAVLVTRKKKHKPDYYTFFIMGLCWIPIGIALDNFLFSIMGFIFVVIGLANKNKWKKNRFSWKKAKPWERKLRISLIIILGILLLAGLVAWFLAERGRI